MTSSNGNIFRVTGHLCGEFTGPQWIPRTKASDAELSCFLWSAPRINRWVNNRGTGDLRRYRVHDDVIVMWCNNDQVSKVTMVTQPMVSSVPLIHQFFKGWSPSISCSYLTDVAAISPVFQNHQNTGYPYDITFIFQRCHRSLAMVTFVKYECDLKNITSTFARSKIYLTEKLMNGALVTPTLVVLVRKHQQQQRRPTWLHRNLTVIQ